MSTTDLIFGRETENRIYNGAVGFNTDGNCKINDHTFCSVYLDAASVEEPTVIATSYDKVTKTQTNGSAQKVSAVQCDQCRVVYISDDRAVFAYIKTATNTLHIKVSEVSETVFNFGSESADIFGGVYTCHNFEICKVHTGQLIIIATCIKVATSTPYIVTIAFSISGMAVFTIGSPLEISERTSEAITYDEFAISALDIYSVAIIYYVDTTKNTYTVKIDLTGNEQAINQTPYLIQENVEASYPAICGTNTNRALIVHNSPSGPTTTNCDFYFIDYSENEPFWSKSTGIVYFSQCTCKFTKISNGSIISAVNKIDEKAVELHVWNFYGDNYFRTYEYKTDAHLTDKQLFGIHIINEGELVLFLDDYELIAPTTYNIDANLISYLGGVSSPTFSGFDEIDFGVKDVGSNSSETFILKNDGIYPEEIDVACTDFYFNDDDGLLSKSATIRVNGLFILCAEHYDYLKDPKGNVLQAIL